MSKKYYPYHIVTYYNKWVKSSRTYSMIGENMGYLKKNKIFPIQNFLFPFTYVINLIN